MRVDNGGVATEFEVTGSGPPVVLLHGFPDRGRLWRHQVPVLAEAGYQVVVPDLRGYGASDKPEEVEAYGLLDVVGDVLAVLDDLGVPRAHVVGHDWGAAVAWMLASFVPDRVGHLAALSVGHPRSFRTAGIPQLEKSWYMLLFQFPGVGEEWLAADGWAGLRNWTHHPDIEAVIRDLEADGSLTPGLNWYRANVPPAGLVGPPPEFPPVASPVMGVWGTDDFALGEEQMTGSSSCVTGPWRYERLSGAGHWLQLDQPAAVNRLLVDFLPSPGHASC
ncbi:MAG TPA: alpha/beta fold hydrolase [Acidimicrobiales bacterium]|nr:alpha/beta fold hydrolase [Acidimicrobiales bacterium]